MTPKDKAIELYEKFIFPCWECDEFDKAKQCALIAVDEILHITSKRVSWFNVRGMYKERFVLDQYWVEVKQEIEKL
jgi:hypothetical protein